MKKTKSQTTKFKRRDPIHRRKAILDAARALLADREFSAIRLEDVAAKAGVGKGTVFLYFGSKEELFRTLLHEMFQSARARWDVVCRKFPPGPEKIKALIRDQLSFFETHSGLFLQVFQGTLPIKALFDRPRREKVIMANVQILADALAEGMKAGFLRRTDPLPPAIALFGMIRGFVLTRLLGGMTGSLPERTEIIWEVFSKGLAEK